MTQTQTTPQSDSSRTMMIQGDFDSNQLFSGDAVRRIIDGISEAQKDGYKVVF
jgi:hypothetical protein